MSGTSKPLFPLSQNEGKGPASGMPGPLAITMGDPAGIGPEIVIKAFLQAPELTRGCFVAGDLNVMRRAALVVRPGVPLPIGVISEPREAHAMPPGCIPL